MKSKVILPSFPIGPLLPTIIGIDPGLAGGIAVLESTGASVVPIPVLPSPKGRGHIVDTRGVALFIGEMVDKYVDVFVVIEGQRAMPKQGVTSVFTLGESFGVLLGICEGLGLAYEIVPPKVWQASVLNGLSRTDPKAASILVCQRLFPGVSLRPTPRASKPSDGLSDALLIAEYWRRKMGGGSLPPCADPSATSEHPGGQSDG